MDLCNGVTESGRITRFWGCLPLGMPTYSMIYFVGTVFVTLALALKLGGYPATMTFARAVALIARDHDAISAARMLVLSVKSSHYVFVLFLFLVVFFSIEGMFLFEHYLPLYCTNFQDAFVFSFVFLATGENYADAVPQIMNADGGKGYFLWLALCSLIGLFGLMSLVVATFQTIHCQQQEAHDQMRQVSGVIC